MRWLAVFFFSFTVYVAIRSGAESEEPMRHQIVSNDSAIESSSLEQTIGERTSSRNVQSYLPESEIPLSGFGASTIQSDAQIQHEEQLKNELKKLNRGDSRSNEVLELFRLTQDMHENPASFHAHQKLSNELKSRDDYAEILLGVFDALKANAKFGVEVAGLLELLKNSELDRRQVRDLAEREMLETVSREVPLPEEAAQDASLDLSLSTDETMILPIVAHEVFMDTAVSESDRLEGTLRALSAHANHNVRSIIFEAYVDGDRDRRRMLEAEVRELGITIPGVTMKEGAE